MCQSQRDGREHIKGIYACLQITRSNDQYRFMPVKHTLFSTNNWQIGFKIFLNITPTVSNWTADNKQFSLIFEENPLADFVELPDDGKAQDELWYSNILCGVIRGALEMVFTDFSSDRG